MVLDGPKSNRKSHNTGLGIMMRDLVILQARRVIYQLDFLLSKHSDLEGYYNSEIFMHSDFHTTSCHVQVFL